MVVPYKGTAPAFQDLIGGQIHGFIDPILGSLQYHKSGLLRVVAVTSGDARAQPARGADGSRNHPRLRVLQLVRPVGPGQVAGRRDAAPELRGQQGPGRRDEGQAGAAGPAAHAGSVDDFAKFQAADMARAQKIITEGNIRVE
jgi:hypothetical protein